jgi:hypothetical protein
VLAWNAFATVPHAGPGAYLCIPALARAGIGVTFSGRNGGSSLAPWATLNLSYSSGDDPETVRTNRDRVLEPLGLDAGSWTGGRQVHGTRIARITRAERGRGADSPATTIPETDALWTDEPGIALAVVVADCVPIVLADAARRRVAVVHAGWRGLVGGIVARGVEAFGDPSTVVAVAGPSIGPCCYEVGDDVAQPAMERFGKRVMREGNLDLWGGTAAALREAGVRDVTVAALCTRCQSHRFFSHRAGDTARQCVAVALAT